MKHLFVLLLFLASIGGGANATAAELIPDVLGRVNALEDGTQMVRPPMHLPEDPIPLQSRATWNYYPDWPVSIPGTGEEGGIMVNVDGDPELEIVHASGNRVSALNIDGSAAAGWPQDTLHTVAGAPAAGDIDGDGDLEIVVNTWAYTPAGQVVAWELDGTLVPGFPVDNGYATRSAVLADLDGDDALEIITNTRLYPVGQVSVYRGDGTIFPGWPQDISHVPASSAAAGDIDGDGDPEVLAEAYDALFAWHHDGTAVSGFPFVLPTDITLSYSSPVLADLDGDNLREIIFATGNSGGGDSHVYALNGDGTVVNGWPTNTSYWNFAPPAVCDLDGDGGLDVVVADQILSTTPICKLYAWDAAGNALPGFPVTGIEAVFAHPLAADLDGDDDLEILITDNVTYAPGGTGRLHAWHHDGTVSTDFPVFTFGTSFLNVPNLGDLNNDGLLDLVGGGSNLNDELTNISAWGSNVAWDPAGVIIPCFNYNIRHDGKYPSIDPVDTVSCSMTCSPNMGTVPFSTTISLAMDNTHDVHQRRIAARLDATMAGGQTFSPWRSGYANMAANSTYFTSWVQWVPALGLLIGENMLEFTVEDVTPPPYNQPPYPPAGDTASVGCTVTVLLP